MFLGVEVRDGEVQLDAGGQRHRPDRTVRGDLHVVGLGIVAMRKASVMPPQWAGSGWAIAMPAASTGRNSSRQNSRSPVAIGTLVVATRRPIRCECSGRSGSSKNAGAVCAAASASRRA